MEISLGKFLNIIFTQDNHQWEHAMKMLRKDTC